MTLHKQIKKLGFLYLTVLFLYAVINVQILQASYVPLDLCQCILNNPDDVLRSNKEHRNNFYKQRTECLVNNIRNVYNRELYNPIFLLEECKKEGCLLDRTLNPKYREVFQEHFLKAVLPKIQKKSYLYWLSFASGGLFQDLCTACKLLEQYPTLKLSLDLLDLEFEPLVRFLKVTKQDCKFDVDKCSKILESSTTADNKFFSMSMMVGVWEKYLMLRQFNLFFKRYFPAAKISMRIYATVSSYIEDMKNKNILPHIVTAVGIVNCSSKQNTNDYKDLCFEILRHNSKALNLCLDRVDDGRICLLKATLNKKDILVFNKEFIF